MAVMTSRVPDQPPPLVPYDALQTDAALRDALALWGASTRGATDVRIRAGGVDAEELDKGCRDQAESAAARLAEIGAAAGSEEARAWALAAHGNPPRLVGDSDVAFDPAWHRLLEKAIRWGLHGTPWLSDEPAAHVTRAAGFYLWSQAEAGHGCPISMTYAAVPALRVSEPLFDQWAPRLASTAGRAIDAVDDGEQASPGAYATCLAGMGMTEVQGGSDLRGTTTRAEPSADGTYRITGHKWFFSSPMSDVFLVLAQAPGGLSCFVVPRLLPDGTPNPRRLVRLKDKLGNRSNASSEVEFDGTVGWLLGEEGRGIPTIIAMVAATRLDCVLGSAAVQRRAVAEAIWWASHRTAFGALLRDQPLMRNVLADLAVEQEAATWLGLRLAKAVDADEQALLRIVLPSAKYLVCKRTPTVVAEALECLGGNGYVDDSGMPVLYGEAPLNSIWEGSGSVQALDLLRALRREPQSLEAWLLEVGEARGEDPHLDRAIDDVLTMLSDPDEQEFRARRLTERMALVLQGALLVRHAPPQVAEAFCAGRLDLDTGVTHGTLPRSVTADAILQRSFPL